MVTRQEWAEFRKPTWEEDISFHHDSTEPFVNHPPPSEMPIEEFRFSNVCPEELLDGVPLETFVKQDSIPIPDAADRENYNPNFNARYFMTGLADYLKIMRAARKYDLPVNSYLDFGCASGRVLRHFCCHSEVSDLWGTDLNGRHIRWLNEHLPRQLKVIHNHAIPSLPVADASMDVVSAFSVFTHLDIFETAWLAELYRILKPGGLAYLTVHNEDTWKILQAADESNNLLRRFHEVGTNFGDLLAGDIPDGRTCFRYTDVGPYRALVLHSNSYLQQTWGRYFEIQEIVGRYHGHAQSVVIARKPG